MKIEYKVREVIRHVVTRWHEDGPNCGSEQKGEFDNADVAYQVAYALCRDEHERLGYPIGDERVQYPRWPYASDDVKPGLHASDCAVNNGPALEPGPCDCGLVT